MGSHRRAALAGIQERRQALELDLPAILKQNPASSTYALEHASAQRRIGFLQVDWYKQLKLCCLLVPWCLLGRRSEMSLILLWASPIAAASTVEGSGVQSKEDWRIRCMGGTPQRKWRGCHREQTQGTTPFCARLLTSLVSLYSTVFPKPL
jgi:hypothetical protein